MVASFRLLDPRAHLSIALNARDVSAWLIPMEHAVPSCACGKGRDWKFHKQSVENLWKSFNNVLCTIDDSAVCRYLRGDPDYSIRRKNLKKNPGALETSVRLTDNKQQAQGLFFKH